MKNLKDKAIEIFYKVKNIYRNRDNPQQWRRSFLFGEKTELILVRQKEIAQNLIQASTSDILTITWKGRFLFSTEEEFYYLNHIKFYRQSRKMYNDGDFREALLNLHLSLEMLLKHLISKTIHYYNLNGKEPPTEVLEVFNSHDISSISKSLMLVITDFRSRNLLDMLSELNTMKNHVGRWAQLRYSNPYSKNNISKCHSILKNLFPKVAQFRFDLKSKGVIRWT